MSDNLHIDVETRSAVDLRKTGAYVYFEDDTTDFWCAAYAFDERPPELWLPGEPCPEEIDDHIRSGGILTAHNASFERLAFNYKFGPKYSWPVPKLTQWRCTMAMALALALPAALEDACAVTKTDIQKDAAGGRVMKQMAKPRKPRKGEPTDKLLWWDTQEKREILYKYCQTDVEAERALEKKLRALIPSEQVCWWIDQAINDRGVYVDRDLCYAALKIVDTAKERLNAEMIDITNGAVNGTTAVAQIKAYLRDEHGFDGDNFVEAVDQAPEYDMGYSLAKDKLAEILIRNDIPANARRVLELRSEGSKASVSKIEALLRGTQADGRSRGLLQYHAASTGRWGGRRFQPQNLKRPLVKDVDTAIEAISTGDIDIVDMMFGDPLSVLGDIVRGMVCAEPGNELLCADYSNVEGRVLAWLAGEKWKIDAFKAYDAGEGPDLYKLAYGNAFDIHPTAITSQQRQVGKVMELACLAGGTMVVTEHGYKRLDSINVNDKLWDGTQWVKHEGLLDKGVRQVVNVNGIEVTPDHLIKTGRTWTPAQELVSNQNTLDRALATGSDTLPSWISSKARKVGSRQSRFNATVACLPTALNLLTCGAVKPHDATDALYWHPLVPEEGALARKSAFRTFVDYLAALALLFVDVIIHPTKGIPIMAGEASRFTNPGAKIAACSSSTLQNLKGGMIRLWKWTVLTSTKVMSPGTSVSFPAQRTTETDEVSGKCKNASTHLKRVYDIAFAGPLNRFTVKTDSGFLLVHNCGYEGGVGAFLQMAAGYNVQIGEQYEFLRDTAPDNVIKQVEGGWKSRGRKMGVEIETWMAAEIVKVSWRNAHPATKQYWRDMEDAAIAAMKTGGKAVRVGDIRFFTNGSFLFMELPYGRRLAYAFPKLDQKKMPWENKDGSPVYKESVFFKAKDSTTGQWRTHDTYGGKLVENACQAVARDLLAEALPRLEKAGYPTILTVHDEAMTELEIGKGDLAEYEKLIAVKPEWADGLPLVAEGWRGKRYRK